MSVVTKAEAVDRLAKAVEQARADDLAEISTELFPHHEAPGRDGCSPRAAGPSNRRPHPPRGLKPKRSSTSGTSSSPQIVTSGSRWSERFSSSTITSGVTRCRASPYSLLAAYPGPARRVGKTRGPV